MKSAGNERSNSAWPRCGAPHWAKGMQPESNQASITSGTRRKTPGIPGSLPGHVVDPRLVHPQMRRQRRILLAGGVERVERARIARQDLRHGRGRLDLAGDVVDPEIQRRPPEALPGQRPVDVVAQEVAEATVADVRRQPLDPGVVRQRLLDEGGGAHVPRRPRVLDQRILLGTPAEGVVVAVALGVPEEPALRELPLQVPVAGLDPAAGMGLRRDGRIEAAVGTDRAEQRKRRIALALAAEDVEVDLAKGRRDVDDARASVELHEIRRHHAPAAFGALAVRIPVERRPVALTHESGAGHRSLDGELAADLGGQRFHQGLRHDQPLLSVAQDGVGDVRPDRCKRVRRKRPGRRRPGQERRARVVTEGEPDVDRRVVHRLVALPHLGGGECRPALGPPPHDLVSLVEQAALEELG